MVRGLAAFGTLPLLLGACTVLGGQSGDDSAPKAGADSATTAAASPVLSSSGPGHRVLTAGWTVKTPVQESQLESRLRAVATGHTLANGQLVAASRRGIDANDATTGKPRWHYYERGRQLYRYGVTGGAVVVITRSANGRSTTERWVGLDAPSGRVLWTSGSQGEPIPADRLGAVGGGGTVPVRATQRGEEIKAVDARTGRTRWSQRGLGEGGCTVGDAGPVDGDGSLVFLRTRCQGAADLVHALDPATGKLVWRRATAQSIAVRQGVTLLTTGEGTMSLLARDGRVLVSGSSSVRCHEGCLLAATGERAAIAPAGGADHRLLTVDLSTGTTISLTGRGPYVALTAAADGFYGLRESLGGPLLATAVDLISARGREVRTAALPYATGSSNAAIGGGKVTALSVAGERIFVTQTVQKQAWATTSSASAPGGRPGPPELGGTPPADWPDACTLAPGFRKSATARSAPANVGVGAVRLGNLSCTVTKGGDADATRVNVAWVAPTPREARQRLSVASASAVSGLGDEAYLLGGSFRYALLIRVGRYVITFDEDGPATRAAAGLIAQTLRQRS